MTFLTV